MKVLLKEIGGIDSIDSIFSMENDNSFSLFDNIKSILKFDRNSELYADIRSLEKKINWLEYNNSDFYDYFTCKHSFYSDYGYISILNSYLKIDNEHILLLCFANIPDMSCFDEDTMDEKYSQSICKNVEKYREVIGDYLIEEKEKHENDIGYFNFEEYFNNEFFDKYVFKTTKSSNFNFDRQFKFVRELNYVYWFAKNDFNNAIKSALETGLLDLSIIPCLYGIVYETPKKVEKEGVRCIKIVGVDDKVLFNTNVKDIKNVDSVIDINLVKIWNESAIDFVDYDSKSTKYSFRNIITNDNHEEIPIKIEKEN